MSPRLLTPTGYVPASTHDVASTDYVPSTDDGRRRFFCCNSGISSTLKLCLNVGRCTYWRRVYRRPRVYWRRVHSRSRVYWRRVHRRPRVYWRRVYRRPRVYWRRLHRRSRVYWRRVYCCDSLLGCLFYLAVFMQQLGRPGTERKAPTKEHECDLEDECCYRHGEVCRYGKDLRKGRR